MPVLSADFVKPVGTVVGIIALFLTLFNKYMWSWKILRVGTLNVQIYEEHGKLSLKAVGSIQKTGQVIAPIYGYAAIRQSLTFLSVRLMTKESRSVLVAHSIEQQEDDDLFKLVGVYRNEPKIELQGVRSEIHHGSFALDIHGSPAYSLEGHYWTDRATKGGMKLSNREKKLYDTYEQALSETGN